jgi:hypothetical protein
MAFYDPANFTFPAGCHIAEIEIDPTTGATRIVNFTAVDDFGKVVNPMIVEGQVHGGASPKASVKPSWRVACTTRPRANCSPAA